MTTDFDSIDPNISLQSFVHDGLMRTGRRCFLVTQNGALLGLITPNEVREVNAEDWSRRTVASVMRPASTLHLVSPEIPAWDALETMVRENVHQLPVMKGGRIEGIIDRRHILQAMRSRQELSGITHLPHAA